jgi:hypothetical protein
LAYTFQCISELVAQLITGQEVKTSRAPVSPSLSLTQL